MTQKPTMQMSINPKFKIRRSIFLLKPSINLPRLQKAELVQTSNHLNKVVEMMLVYQTSYLWQDIGKALLERFSLLVTEEDLTNILRISQWGRTKFQCLLLFNFTTKIVPVKKKTIRGKNQNSFCETKYSAREKIKNEYP